MQQQRTIKGTFWRSSKMMFLKILHLPFSIPKQCSTLTHANDKKDDFNNDDDVDICGNDNDLSVDSNSDFYDLDQGPSTSKISGGFSPFPDSDNQNQENCSDLDSDDQSGMSEKLKKW